MLDGCQNSSWLETWQKESPLKKHKGAESVLQTTRSPRVTAEFEDGRKKGRSIVADESGRKAEVTTIGDGAKWCMNMSMMTHGNLQRKPSSSLKADYIHIRGP